MGVHGMLAKEGEASCLKCGEPLNKGGLRPAEIYAGTYTGLCYSCERSSAFCTHVELLDRAEHWDFPPHCPSWRRYREKHVGYSDCPDCDGRGSKWMSRSDARGGSYRTYCDTCFHRYYDNPVRKRPDDRKSRIRIASMNATVNHLLKSKLASRRKRRNDDTGVRMKDNNQKVIWVYCDKETLASIIDEFSSKGAHLISKYVTNNRRLLSWLVK